VRSAQQRIGTPPWTPSKHPRRRADGRDVLTHRSQIVFDPTRSFALFVLSAG
jgi:hypothetical protein